jgi:hypothetical protein
MRVLCNWAYVDEERDNVDEDGGDAAAASDAEVAPAVRALLRELAGHAVFPVASVGGHRPRRSASSTTSRRRGASPP